MNQPQPAPISTPVSQPPVAAGTPERRWLRIVARTVLALFALLLLLILGLTIYTHTADFQRRAGAKVVSVLEDSTGGRVELNHVSLSLWHLAIEADGLVIHGTEAPGEMPYISASKIFVRLHLNLILTHIAGVGPQSRISLRYLRVEQPHIHLIIDKDGHTNQPTPKHPSAPSNEPLQDTLLDLQARKVELADGLAVLNDRAIPFDLAANNLNAQVLYLKHSDRYSFNLDLTDLRTKMAQQPEVQSRLHLTAQVGRDMASLDTFDFTTGASTHLNANAAINHFAKPEWQAGITGAVDLKQLSYLANVEGLDAGSLDLDVHSHNCIVTPQAAQQHTHFWQRHNKTPPPAGAKVLPPDPDCKAGYLLIGNIKLHNAGYSNADVRLHDINGGAQLRITPTELLFTALSGYLPGGGNAKGDLKIENWLGEVPANTAAGSATTVAAATTANTTAKGLGAKAPIDTLHSAQVGRAHAYLTVTVDHIPLRTIMEVTEKHYGDLGLDTSITGPTTVEWGGPANTVSESVQVQASLKLTPTGHTRPGALQNVPVSGDLDAHYDGLTETVKIKQINLQTPQTTLTSSGILGVSDGDPLTNLQVNLQARDLGEFDQLLQTLGFSANGKTGTAAIPVVLHGTMAFTGTARGAIADLDVKGHLNGDNLALRLGTTADIHIDSVVADAEYSPYEGVAVGSSTISRGSAVLNLAGSFRPHKTIVHRVATYDWSNQLAIDATVSLANAQATDLLDIAGQKDKIPVTGTVNVISAHAVGTPQSLTGSGQIAFTNGTAYGEAYQTISLNVTAQGNQIDATNLLLAAHGLKITGSGGYNLSTKRIRASLAGNDLLLSKFDLVRKASPNADGVLSFTADADGTLTEPNLHARLSLANLVIDAKPIGQLNATAHSVGSDVFYNLDSTLVGAKLAAAGQTSLAGDYQTSARLTLTNLDIANAIDLFAPDSFKGSSNIAGTVTLTGPAARPTLLAGTAEFPDFDLKLQGIELKAAEPLRISLRDGKAVLDQVHITGQDTDLRAGGTAVLFGDPNPQGGTLNLTSSGSVSMALAHTFDPDLITSGKVTFKVAAEGRLRKPSLTGNVLFQGVNLAVDGVPNGLSDLNGTLKFNEDRLDVENLTAMTGGGQLKIGGYLAYQKGIFADLTATGDVVRVRYNGLSATANAAFRLQGGPSSLLLSGNALITRFSVGADVDFAAFSSGSGVQAPPDPNSATNKIRLDIHIVSSPQLDFQNSFAKLAGTVDLTVRGTLAVPSVLGRIQITDGSATFAGTTYQLQRGNVYFSNPVRIDPTFDLDATARVENYDLTISAHGNASNPKLTYRSEPPLTEADIFNLLALGRTQEEAQLYQEQQVQAGTDPTTSALLGGALTPTFDLDATARVENYDLTISAHGNASNPKLTYRSEPPLTEADIFNLLALGRTQEEAQLYQEQQVQAGTDPTTSALLGGALNATVSSRVGKLFGAGSVKIDPAFVGTLGNSSARITVSEPLSKQLTLVFATNVNESAEQLIQVQYQLSETKSIVATRDESGVFSVVYKIRKRYR